MFVFYAEVPCRAVLQGLPTLHRYGKRHTLSIIGQYVRLRFILTVFVFFLLSRALSFSPHASSSRRSFFSFGLLSCKILLFKHEEGIGVGLRQKEDIRREGKEI